MPEELQKLLGEKARSSDLTLGEEILVRVKANGFSRMPPRETLSDGEVENLKRYLDAVKSPPQA